MSLRAFGAGLWRLSRVPLKLLLAVGLLYYLVRSNAIDTAQILGLVNRPSVFILAFVLGCLSIEVNTARWFLLLRGYGVPVPYRPIWLINYLSCFLGNFLPGLLGVDGTRLIYMMRRWKDYRVEAAATVLLDRALGAYTLILLGWLATFAATSELVAIKAATAALTAAVLGIPLLAGLGLWLSYRAGSPRGGNREDDIWLTRIMRKVYPVHGRWRSWATAILAGLALSFIGQGLILAVIVVLANGMVEGSPLGSADYLVAGTLGLLSNTIPLTPGGLGIGEGLFDQVCRLLAADTGLSYGGAFLAARTVFALSTLPGAAMWVATKSFETGGKTGA